MSLELLAVKAADACEQFVRESRELDLAHFDGTLDEWLDGKLKRELAIFRGSAELVPNTDGPRSDDAGQNSEAE